MKHFMSATLVALCLACFAGTAFAQESKTEAADESATTVVTGQIIDAITGEAIPGVRVEGYGNNRCTAMTGAEGNFSIRVPKEVTSLYVSTPGYAGVIIAARQPEKGDLVIRMYEDTFTDFASKDFTLTDTENATIDLSAATTVETELETQLSGLIRAINRSGTPGMGAMMMIQGLNTINTSTQPLVILDGVIQDIQDGYSAVHDGFFNNILPGIDPTDIESIQVIKNGTAIYGAKGGNGVILINTRRGHSMATRIEANISGGYTLEPTLPTMMNASQYRTYANELMGGVTTYENARYPFL